MTTAERRRWTLRTKIVASIVALYVVVTLVTGAATVFAWRASQLGQIDDQLKSAAQVLGGQKGEGTGNQSAPIPGAGLAQLTCSLLDEDGSRLTVPQVDGTRMPGCYVSGGDGTRTEISQRQADAWRADTWSASPRTITVNGDSYRAVAVSHPARVLVDDVPTRQQVTDVRALPLEPLRGSTIALSNRVALVGLLGLLVVGGAAWLIVSRSLAPLRRVAGTALRVTRQPLSRGQAETTERVSATDTDPHTEVGQVGLALNDLLEHVDQSLAARHRSETQVRQFVADASHELRTPLASIKGYAELSRREPDPVPESITHALARIESESDRMTMLVEDMLLLARLDAGRPLTRERSDLTLAAIETVSDAQAAGPEHQWALDLPDEPCEIVGDDARLRQVLINLLANARRHTPPGTVVTTAVRPLPGGVELTVADSGPGIPPELQPHIFERFARGDSARGRREGSTGLGLAIVHAVVTAHGGQVGLQSEPGRTVFTVTLPTEAPGPA